MLIQQKRAWFVLSVFLAFCITALILLLTHGPRSALATVGILCLWGLGPILFRARSGSPGVIIDERDEMIARHASMTGFVASYLSIPLACMIPWFVGYTLQGKETVSIHMMVIPVVIAAIVLWMVRSVMLLLLYREGMDDVQA